jgi:hypothetical protein
MREDYHARGRPRPVAIGDQSAAAAVLALAAARAWRCGWSCNSPSAWVIWLVGMSMTFQSGLLHLAVVTVLTVLLAIALYAWVDRPVDRWRQRAFRGRIRGSRGGPSGPAPSPVGFLAVPVTRA